MAETVFNVVSENPQKEHVAKEVEPTAVHEHCSEDRYRLPHGVRGKSCGDKRPFLDELIATTEFHQKHQNIQRDENVCDDRKRATLGIVVTNWKHRAASLSQ
jgi:hypothetical protein